MFRKLPSDSRTFVSGKKCYYFFQHHKQILIHFQYYLKTWTWTDSTKDKEKRKDIFQCCGRSDPLKQDQQDKLCQSIIYNIVWKKSLIYTGI